METVTVKLNYEDYKALQDVRPVYQEDSEPFIKTENQIFAIIGKYEKAIQEQE